MVKSVIEISLISYPQTIKQFDGNALKWSKEIPDADETIKGILNHTEDPFDAIRLLKVIKMFEPERIRFEEK